jgi:membrane protein implicated in regulation of membrane protease activity
MSYIPRVLMILAALLVAALLVDLIVNERWLDVLLLILIVVLLLSSYALNRYARKLLYERSRRNQRAQS